MLPTLLGLWLATGVQRAIGAYMGYGRNLFVRRVELEAERRPLYEKSDYVVDAETLTKDQLVTEVARIVAAFEEE